MNDLIASAALGDPTTNPPVKVDNKMRQAWNDYTNFLQKKGLKGHPSLDHNNLGFQMIEQYRKENPGTPLTKDAVIPIQQDFSNYRNYALKQIDDKKAALADGVKREDFLKALSTVDGIPGQRTTSYKFPLGYMKDMNTGEVKNKGFATTDKSPDELLATN